MITVYQPILRHTNANQIYLYTSTHILPGRSMSLDVDRCVRASIENVLRKYTFLHPLASPGPSESAQRADTMLTILYYTSNIVILHAPCIICTTYPFSNSPATGTPSRSRFPRPPPCSRPSSAISWSPQSWIDGTHYGRGLMPSWCGL